MNWININEYRSISVVAPIAIVWDITLFQTVRSDAPRNGGKDRRKRFEELLDDLKDRAEELVSH